VEGLLETAKMPAEKSGERLVPRFPSHPHVVRQDDKISSVSDDRIALAHELEKTDFEHLKNQKSDDARSKIAAIRQEATLQRAFQGSRRLLSEMQVWSTCFSDLYGSAIEKRRQLGSHTPELLNEENLKQFSDWLCAHAKTLFWVLQNGIDSPASLPLVYAISEQITMEVQKLCGNITNRVNSLRLSAKLQPAENPDRKSISIVINGGNIGNLNLGTVLGDLNSSIHSLQDQGAKDLAEALRQFAEAVGNSNDLTNSKRKDALECLSVVTAETARPANQRKERPLRDSLASISTLIGASNQILTMWNDHLAPLLRAHGISV
jgi:hypothetical protein